MKVLLALATGYLRALGTLLRSFGRALGGRGSLLFSLFFVALLALLFFVGTEPGRVALTRTAIYGAERLVPNLRIQAPEIGSAHLGEWRFPALRVDYRDGVLVQARDLVVDIDLGGLLHNRIDIETIAATSLRLDDDVLNELLEAQVQPAEEVVDQTPEPLSLPQMRLGSLRVDRLEVIDQRLPDLPVVAVTSDGRYQWEGEPAGFQLEIRELDGAGLHIAVNGREAAEQRFLLEITARENAGGFAGRYLQLPDGEALDARGRLRLWQPRENRLLVDIEEFSLPLVDHHFALAGRAAITLAPWKVATEKLSLEVDDTRHQIAGSVSADAVDAEIKFNRLPVSISKPWQEYLRGGWLTADLSVRGPLSLPAVSGVVDLNTHYRDQPLRLQGRVQTHDEVIQLEAVTLEYADARLDAGGSVDVGGKAIDLKGQVHALTVDELRHLLAALPGTEAVEIPADLQGAIEKLQVQAKGPWDNPALSARLQAAPVYRQLSAQLGARVEGDLRLLNITDLQLKSDNVTVSGGGKVAIADEALDLKLSVQARDFRPAEQLGVAAAEGVVISMDTALDVKGPWKNPQMRARIQSDGHYREYRYTLNGGAVGDLKKVTLDRLRLELAAGEGTRHFEANALEPQQSLIPSKPQPGGDSATTPRQSPLPQKAGSVAELAKEARQLGRSGNAWLEVNGVIEPEAGRAKGTVAGRNIPVSLAELAGVDLPPSLEGEISIDGSFAGPFTKPEASVNLLALGEFRSEPWQLQGNVQYASGRIDLSDVELVWAERNQLSAQGSLNEKQLDLEIRGRGRLADLELGLPAELAERGEVTLYATAAGSPKRPQLNGELKLLSNDGGTGGPLSLVLGWQTQGDDLHVALGAQRGDRRAAQLRGKLAVTPILTQLFAQHPAGAAQPPLPLKLTSDGSADLSVLGEFIDPEIHAMRGQLNFTLDADGDMERPNFNGRIELSGGDYEHRPSNTRLRHIELLARLTPDEWRIERAHAEDGEKGTLDLGGAVSFRPAAPAAMNFELRARKLHLLNTPAVRGAVSGTLVLDGTTEDAQVAGKLTLRPLSVQLEQLIGTSVPEIEVVEVEVDGPQVKQGPPLLDKIALAIQVVVDQQSYVRGLGLNSELRGEVDIAGTAAKPQASGALKIVRGNFDLLGKRFELQEGQVQFENNVAAIYVKGRHTYTDGEITAEISGTLSGAKDDLDVTFSSTPAAAQDEIFAQLLFGKSLSDISPLQAVRLVSVVRTLQSGGSAFDPVAKTRELLGVDTLDLQREESDEGDQYALSLGKYITNRIYIELQRSTDPLNPWEAKMQIELRRNLNLEIKSADSNGSGAGSVELQWKNDY
ncbi:translocation/assembly module TamB domain-containing protein [Microbulbifer hainanensis]|uniref:translocation/assembly module TamB domain-containing protein n=1 Tax=Microbulbifer hainanensis TaxID=2735675 RepID=UPI001867DAE1|nr:translocation/assembly module TamB [Microbulbifer hainanensis]